MVRPWRNPWVGQPIVQLTLFWHGGDQTGLGGGDLSFGRVGGGGEDEADDDNDDAEAEEQADGAHSGWPSQLLRGNARFTLAV